MTIGIPPEVEKALTELAKERRIPPHLLAIDMLQEKLGLPRYDLTPRNEWEERLLKIGRSRDLSPSDEALSREHLYDD
jgi:hypothetical protein